MLSNSEPHRYTARDKSVERELLSVKPAVYGVDDNAEDD
jgi:hypothetical protein